MVLFVTGIFFYYGRLFINGGKWATHPSNSHLYSDGRLLRAGDITDRSGTVLASTRDGQRHFNENYYTRVATAHTVGDLEGFVSTGIHSAFLPELTGYDVINGTYNESGKGNDITRTIDSDLCVTALRSLGNRAGTVGVCNYKTGEIICMVSSYTFDPEEKSTLDEQKEGVYVNRLLSGQYTPGSVFKLVTCLSALENFSDFSERKYTCQRGVTLSNEWLSCLSNHGTLGIKDGLAQSCNAVFSQVALDVGKTALTNTANEIGFNKALYMDGIKCAESKFDVSSAPDIDLGWAGIGQYNDIANPYQYMRFMAAVANGGVSVSPHVVKSITSPDGTEIRGESSSEQRLISADSAKVLKEYMRNNVKTTYGDYSFPGLELCAKTGTAEVGENATPHSWFVGFSDLPEKPYAFVVVAENAGSGLGVASSIASRVLRAAGSV